MSEESESYRLDMLRRLEQKYDKSKPAEVLEAEKIVAKHRKEQEEAGPQISRASLPLPKPDLCPSCWIKEGHETPLQNIPADDPEKFDRWRCRTCGYSEDREA